MRHSSTRAAQVYPHARRERDREIAFPARTGHVAGWVDTICWAEVVVAGEGR